MDFKELKKLVSAGESGMVEFKKSTGQLRRAAETLCSMLSGPGGRVLIGVTAEGRILGQTISDKTLRDVAEILLKFEPPASATQIQVKVTNSKAVLILEATPNPESRPYAFDGRPYQWIGTTTSVMPQPTYQRLLRERVHSHIRVELCVKAGHPEPEFGEQAGSVWVRFLPSGYIAPHRVNRAAARIAADLGARRASATSENTKASICSAFGSYDSRRFGASSPS